VLVGEHVVSSGERSDGSGSWVPVEETVSALVSLRNLDDEAIALSVVGHPEEESSVLSGSKSEKSDSVTNHSSSDNSSSYDSASSSIPGSAPPLSSVATAVPPGHDVVLSNSPAVWSEAPLSVSDASALETD
jgi:hypothetical protein